MFFRLEVLAHKVSASVFRKFGHSHSAALPAASFSHGCVGPMFSGRDPQHSSAMQIEEMADIKCLSGVGAVFATMFGDSIKGFIFGAKTQQEGLKTEARYDMLSF